MFSQPKLRRFLGSTDSLLRCRTWLGCVASFVRYYGVFIPVRQHVTCLFYFQSLAYLLIGPETCILYFASLACWNQPCSYLHISREIFSNLFLSFTHNKELKSQSTRRYRSTNAGPLVFRGGQVCSLRSHPRPGHPVRRVQTLRAHDGQR